MDIRDLSVLLQKNSEKFAEVMSACSTILKYSSEAKEVREYLKTRVPNKVNGFNFGYFPKNSELPLLEKFCNLDDLEKIGLTYKKYVYDSGHPELKYFSILGNHNLVMPYKNTYGDIVGLVGRTLLSKEEQKIQNISKYKNSSMVKAINLFGFYDAKQAILEKDAVIVVEGQLDCITCHRFGFKNVVALGGAAFTQFHFYLIKRYTNNIFLLLDNDETGQKAKNNIINRFGSLANIKEINIPTSYKDIDDYLMKGSDLNILNV